MWVAEQLPIPLDHVFTAGGTWLSDLLRLDGSDNLTHIFQISDGLVQPPTSNFFKVFGNFFHLTATVKSIVFFSCCPHPDLGAIWDSIDIHIFFMFFFPPTKMAKMGSFLDAILLQISQKITRWLSSLQERDL